MNERDQRAPAAGRRRMGVIWEGPVFAHHSFATVNREVASLLARRDDIDLGVIADAPEEAPAAFGSASAALAGLRGHRPSPVDCHVRHRWPPVFVRPRAGRLVVVQPWEFSQVPTAWVDAIDASVDQVWTPSAFSRDAFVRGGVDPRKVVVVSHGVNPDVFHPDVPAWSLATDRTFRFLFVGGATERKGFDLLLRAYVREFTADDDVCLVVKDFHYGDHAREVVRDLLRRRGAPEILYSYGTTAPARLGGLFTACQCSVHPYRGEGFGLPIAEAMACGLPVIVTGAGPAVEYCTDEVGYLVPAVDVPVPAAVWSPSLPTPRPPRWYAPDVDALRRSMRRVYEHQEEARGKGARASERTLGHLTWEKTVEVIARLLRRRPVTG